MNRFILIFFVCTQLAYPQIVVMRHGQAITNVQGWYRSDPAQEHGRPAHLTEHGIEQVRETAHELLRLGFNAHTIRVAYVSPLARTQQTAAILIENGVISSTAVRTDARLIEVQMGDREGRYYHEFPQHSWDHSSALSYHGETIDQVIERMKHIFNEVKNMSDDKSHVLFITHGTPALKLFEWQMQKYLKLPTAGFYIID